MQQATKPTAGTADPDSLLTDFDLYLFNEGTHVRVYEKLGAHIATADGQSGVAFAVWAPNADAVSVIGEFNSWDPEKTALQPRGSSGIWQGFVPDVGQGAQYKYSIKPRFSKNRIDKADPFGFAAELRPRTASVVWDLDRYAWQDKVWTDHRAEHQAFAAPISVYEVHLGSWKRVPDTQGFLTYRDLAEQLAEYCQTMGDTHVQLMAISAHPVDSSWRYKQ